jgi:ankyrin repeat protein
MRKLFMAGLVLSVACATVFAATSADLIDAVQTKNAAAAIKLLDQKVNVNGTTADGTTALHWAVHNSDIDMVDRLIKAGATVNVKNEFGLSPIIEATNVGNTAIIEKLLKAGADANTLGADGMPPLMIIARSANVAAARLLLDSGANVNFKESQRSQTPLMWANAQRQPDMVAELVKRGAEVNARAMVNNTVTASYNPAGFMDWPANVSSEPRAGPRAAGGFTPLLYATREGCTKCVEALIAGKADLNMTDPESVTPLMMAAWNLHFDTAAVLIKAGADVNRWDLWGRSALYLTADVNTVPHGGRADRPSLDDTTGLDVIRMLLEAGANPNLQLKLFPPYRNTGNDRGLDGMLTIGTTPLLRAAKALDAPAVKLLVQHGAKLDIPNNRGITPVMAAAGMGSTDADTRGWYVTDDVEQRSVDTLKILLDAGANVNSKGPQGLTPLHEAARWGWNAVVQLLVDRGADLYAKTDSNIDNATRAERGLKTVIDSAMGRNGGNSRGGARIDVHEDTAKLLEELMKKKAAAK